MDVLSVVLRAVEGGLASLGSYLAAHVLLCLVPAFFIAGAMTALLPSEAITRYLGWRTPGHVAYPAAALAGSTLAVCSCTIVPLFAGIYRKGAGIGPAVTFLFFAPAGNILALAYTGSAIGNEFAIARVVLSLVFGIGIGMLMALLFHGDDLGRAAAPDDGFAGSARARIDALALLAALIVLLLFGTLKLAVLADPVASLALPFAGADRLEQWLFALAPYDAAKGEEGVTLQGAALIGLLVLIAPVATLGFRSVDTGFSRWTWLALAMVALTLLLAAVRAVPAPDRLTIELPGRFFGVAAVLVLVGWLARTRLDRHEIGQWLWESWRFVRQIFPLLVIGVFAVGVVRPSIRPEWIEAIAGVNSVSANAAGVAFGIFMYFPTLVEVPVAKMFLSLGMHPGPLIAYLMADPELSFQSILMTMAIMGRAKTLAYVALVAIFSTLAGLVFGAWFDGANPWILAGALVTAITTLGLGGWRIRHHRLQPQHS